MTRARWLGLVVALLALSFALAGLAWHAEQARREAAAAWSTAAAESPVRATAEANALQEAHSHATAEASAP